MSYFSIGNTPRTCEFWIPRIHRGGVGPTDWNRYYTIYLYLCFKKYLFSSNNFNDTN